jgi:hypothetical protein
MSRQKKILIVTPRFPLPDKGACEQDRLAGIMQLKRLGYDVMVLAKTFRWQDTQAIAEFGRQNNIAIVTVLYQSEIKKLPAQKLFFYFKRLANPLYWDGAAYEYAQADIKNALRAALRQFQPDAVWFDYTYLWPLYRVVKKQKVPIITRSINFEPRHFLEEDGRTLLNYFKVIPKHISEYMIARLSEVVFAITPREEKIYQKLGAKHTATLPLRKLPAYLAATREIKDKAVLDVFFMGSTYNVAHNRRALEFVLREIAPRAQAAVPSTFRFHILGSKFPDEFKKYLNDAVVYHGYVADLEKFLDNMDIALIPSLFGAGMQQKVFEPLARGIPTITSERGIAGYPFVHDEHVLCATSAEECTAALRRLRDSQLRRELSKNALALSRQLFAPQILDTIITCRSCLI